MPRTGSENQIWAAFILLKIATFAKVLENVAKKQCVGSFDKSRSNFIGYAKTLYRPCL